MPNSIYRNEGSPNVNMNLSTEVTTHVKTPDSKRETNHFER